jgi:DNA-binding beta-propeller fold protein YncE
MNIQNLSSSFSKKIYTKSLRWHLGIIASSSLVLIGAFLWGHHFLADATGVYHATGLLGQFDDTHVHAPVPAVTPADYMSAYTNNRPPINDRGLAPHTTATVADVVNHRLFVSDLLNYRVLVFNLDANDKLIDHAADYVLGEPDMFTRSFSTPATAANTFSAGGGPNGTGAGGLDIDPVRQLLFVADSGNNRVLIFDLSSLSNNMNASFVLGQINFTADAPGTTAVSMNHPTDVAYDSTQNRLYVADSDNNRVLGFDLSHF